MIEILDYSIGASIITPSGRRAVVKEQIEEDGGILRIVCRYEGGQADDVVALQPHQLRQAPNVVPLRLVAVNEKGLRIGQDHPRASLSDAEVERMRDIYEEFPVGHPQHVGFRRLAKMFEVGKSTVRDICGYSGRCQTPSNYRRVVEQRVKILKQCQTTVEMLQAGIQEKVT